MRADPASTLLWAGPDALRPLLVPMEELRAHPRNPRRGATEEIRKALRRFGQQRPLLALPDGTLVAGHHVWRAAGEEGWSHVAVVRSDLEPGEVDAYLIADNRLADLGVYDEAALVALAGEQDDLEGTGYTEDDVAALRAYLGPAGPEPEPDAEVFHVVLTYDEATYRAVAARLDELMAEHGLGTHSDAVEELLRAEG